MTRNLYIGFTALLFAIAIAFSGCNDDEDFDNKPQGIDVNTIEITPQLGALQVAWTPDPADTNFIFLNVKITDQDGKERNYNVSRYNSSLVDTTSTSTSPVAYLLIDKLINQEYRLDFYAYNNTNHAISLGSRVATPLDYTQNAPDSITDIVINGAKKCIVMEWREPKIGSWSTYKGVRFIITNTETQQVTQKEYPVGVRHDSLAIDPGIYSIAMETFSEVGKVTPLKTVHEVEVRLANEIELFDKASRAGWILDANSEEASEGSLEYIRDGEASTYWHSKYYTGNAGRDQSTLPYEITVELEKVQHIGGFIFLQRHNALNRHITDYKIYCKENAGDEWEEVISGTLKNAIERQDVKLRKGAMAKYIKLEILGSTEAPFCCLAEFGLIVFEE